MCLWGLSWMKIIFTYNYVSFHTGRGIYSMDATVFMRVLVSSQLSFLAIYHFNALSSLARVVFYCYETSHKNIKPCQRPRVGTRRAMHNYTNSIRNWIEWNVTLLNFQKQIKTRREEHLFRTYTLLQRTRKRTRDKEDL